MKTKIIILITTILSIGNTFSQQGEGYMVLGNEKVIDWFIRFEVLDEETHMPIQNATVILSRTNPNRVLARLQTGREGIALFIVRGVRHIPGSGTFKITSQNRYPWEMEFNQWDYVSSDDESLIVLPIANNGWVDLNHIPSDHDIAKAIKYGDYSVHNPKEYARKHQFPPSVGTPYFETGPPIFEYNIKLKRVPRYYYPEQEEQDPVPQQKETYEPSKSGQNKNCSSVTYIGKTYRTVQIGTQRWMAENLDVGAMIGGEEVSKDNGAIEKYCYNNNASNCQRYGGLYEWAEMMQYSYSESVQGICPPGWHIPSDSEWRILESNIQDPNNVARELKSSQGWIGYGNGNDSFGFCAMPAGARFVSGKGIRGSSNGPGRAVHSTVNFNGLNEINAFWTSTRDGSWSWARGMKFTLDGIVRDTEDNETAFSVRCIKDLQ